MSVFVCVVSKCVRVGVVYVCAMCAQVCGHDEKFVVFVWCVFVCM